MKSHISEILPLLFTNFTEIRTKDMEIVAIIEGRTSEESRDLAELICEAVNAQEEIVSLLREMLQAADDAGIYVSDASIHRRAQDLLARLTKS